jgi:hypothetical protein
MTRDIAPSCPACRQPDALVALGTRLDRPRRWKPWITALTHLYICAQCHALVEVTDEPQRPVWGARHAHPFTSSWPHATVQVVR